MTEVVVNNTVIEPVDKLLETVYAHRNVDFLQSSIEPVVKLVPKPSLINGIPDGVLALIAPVVAYWCFSMMFHMIDTYKLAENRRIHPSEEMKRRNKAGRVEVLREVILQHIIQTAFGYVAYKFDGPSMTGFELNEMWKLKQFAFKYLPMFKLDDNFIVFFYHYGISAIKLFAAFIFVDTWQFVLHYIMHAFPYMYRTFHSRHHQLYVPYAYGALFNHPLEGFLLDTLGTGIAMLITGLSAREQIILYTVATMKTVDDHCGYVLPLDPFQWIFPNNAVYHDIHHQEFGLKYNFAQPFFTFWDNLCGTTFPAMYTELKTVNGRNVSIEQYKAFLKNRDADRAKKLEKMKAAMEKDD